MLLVLFTLVADVYPQSLERAEGGVSFVRHTNLKTAFVGNSFQATSARRFMIDYFPLIDWQVTLIGASLHPTNQFLVSVHSKEELIKVLACSYWPH